ncbi:MAG: DUF1440 domain-containing protein [Saprospiraceae bacterium]
MNFASLTDYLPSTAQLERGARKVKRKFKPATPRTRLQAGLDHVAASLPSGSDLRRSADRAVDYLPSTSDVRRNANRAAAYLPSYHLDRTYFTYEDDTETDYLKGFIAGTVAGLVGTALKALSERVAPTKPEAAPSAPENLAQDVSVAVTDKHLRATNEEIAEQGIYWTFGALAGGVYGMAAEATPVVRSGFGVPFGAILFAATHESLLPVLDLAPSPARKPAKYQISQLASHLIYGAAVEVVRQGVRELLDDYEF